VKYIKKYIIKYIYKLFQILTGRRWPIIIGAGFGLGMAYSNCERDINASIHQQKSRSCKSEGKK